MTPDLYTALLKLKGGPQPFYVDSLTPLYRQLVMRGLAACRVDMMRDEYVRITEAGRQALGVYA